MKNSMVVPKKLKIELPYDPIPGHTSGRKHDLKDTCTPMFIAALFIMAKTWNQPKCLSTDGWVRKMWFIYTIAYYSAIKKNEIMPSSATWMDLKIHTK